MAAKKKEVTKIVLMTKEQAGELSRCAKEHGMSEGGYIRFLLSQKPNDYPEIRVLLRDLINEINHIGINVNQVVRSYNSGLYSQEEKDCLFAYLQKIDRKLDEVVRQLGD